MLTIMTNRRRNNSFVSIISVNKKYTFGESKIGVLVVVFATVT